MEDFLAELVAFSIVGVIIWLVGLTINAFSKKPTDKKDTENEPK